MDWTAAFVTFKLAATTTLILLLCGVPLAYWLAMTRQRSRFVIEAIVTLPLVLPPTVIGFYILLISGPSGPLGALVQRFTGHTLPFSFAGILLGSVIYNLPFAVRPFAAAFAAVDRRLIEASWCLGAPKLRTFFRVMLPASWPGVLTGLVLTFAHAVGEFGVILMLGGNIPGETRTLSIAIYDDVQALDYDAANATARLLIAFAFIALSITYALQRRTTSL